MALRFREEGYFLNREVDEGRCICLLTPLYSSISECAQVGGLWTYGLVDSSKIIMPQEVHGNNSTGP